MRWVGKKDQRSSDLSVSVIVPVYNPGPHIDGLLDSLAAQTMPQDQFEVILVDDGSTDGTGPRLDEFARQRENLTVRHIPNSGWPGKPRNVGLDLARGEYVLFADNDDVIAPRGLELMHGYATANDSDLVIGREVGRGRVVSKEVFRRSIDDARLGEDPVLGILTPHKLYRRALLEEQGIRFPEGVFRLEDHLVNAKVLLAAKKISVFADEPCYYWTERSDPSGKNASNNDWDPADYYGRSMEAILAAVDDATPPGPLRDKLYAHWYETKMLSRLTDQRYVKYSTQRRRAMYAAVRTLADRRMSPQVDAYLSLRARVRSALVHADAYEALLPLAEAERGVCSTVYSTLASWDDATARISFCLQLSYRDGSPMSFRRNAGGAMCLVPPVPLPTDVVTPEVLDASGDESAYQFDLLVKERGADEDYFAPVDGSVTFLPTGEDDLHRLVAVGTGSIDMSGPLAGRPVNNVLDVYVRLWFGGYSTIHRLPAPQIRQDPKALPRSVVRGRAYEMYMTNMGNWSIRAAGG